MRAAIVGSSIVHLAVLLALFVVRHGPAIVIPGPDVVQVALVEPTPAAPPAPAPAPASRSRPSPPVVKPETGPGVKIAPPKARPKPPEPEAAAPVAPAPAAPAPSVPAPALPSAPVGSAGLRGDVAVDAPNFEFTYYLVLVRNAIAANWSPPAGATGAAVRAVVHFRIARDGRVLDARLESGSGVEFFDRSAVRAVVVSDPLPPLPLAYTGDDLGVHFGFEVTGP